MEISIDMSDLIDKLKYQTSDQIKNIIYKSMESLAIEWEKHVKEIISDNAIDTGEFLNSIHYDMFEENNEIGFIGQDGVNYGIYHEFGTIRHFVPFYKYLGKDENGNAIYDISQPILADWGKRVLGLTEEEMLMKGGINVKAKELKPFMKSLLHIKSESENIFKENMEELL